jgi:hypothetical protein
MKVVATPLTAVKPTDALGFAPVGAEVWATHEVTPAPSVCKTYPEDPAETGKVSVQAAELLLLDFKVVENVLLVLVSTSEPWVVP